MTVNHVWGKYKIKENVTYGNYRVVTDYGSSKYKYVYYSDEYPKSYEFDPKTGVFTFKDYYYPNKGDTIYAKGQPNGSYFVPVSESNSTGAYEVKVGNRFSEGDNYNVDYSQYKGRTRDKIVTKEKGDYIEDIKSPDRNTYPDNGERNGYWYIYKGIDNQKPTVDGYNNDLGNKTENFTVNYVVEDADSDTCTVDILVDGVKKVSSKAVTLGYKYSYDVKINDFTIGSHKIEIIAKDSKGSTSDTRKYTFYKPNIAPVISGEDVDLGGKSSAFVVDYNVTDKNNDSVNVNVLLDDLEIQSVTSAQNQELQLKVTDEMLNNFEIGSNHTITIKADDLKGGISYRRYTFTKTNKPPVISGTDQHLGNKTDTFSVSWSVTDQEKNPISFKVYLDNRVVMQEDEVVDNKTYSYSIPHEEWIKLDYSTHEIRVVAIDSINFNIPVTRKFTFKRVSNGIDIEIKINEFNSKPKKIIVVPHGVIAEDATMHVYACNNYLDSNPTWEDMATESKAARAHSFTNGSKTNAKWAIGIKITVENGKSGLNSVIRGFKGGYE